MKSKLTHSVEDYLEMIYLLSMESNTIRITDIAERMKLRKSSIVTAVKKLESCGFVQHERYGAINLTPEGEREAIAVYRKHKILKGFFIDVLGLPEDIAEKDACNFEHYISDQTVQAIILLAKRLQEK
jgi:DtxR family transcriptional regulator, Mn-dependent transcriptional regulator